MRRILLVFLLTVFVVCAAEATEVDRYVTSATVSFNSVSTIVTVSSV